MDNDCQYSDILARFVALQDKVFVLRISGKIFASQFITEVLDNVANFLYSGVRLIIVLDVEDQAEEKMKTAKIEIIKNDRVIVMQPAAIPLIESAYVEMRVKLREIEQNLKNKPRVAWADEAVLAESYGEGYQSTGKVEAIDARVLSPCPSELPYVPKLFIVPTLCKSTVGEFYYVDANEVAASLAVNLGAKELILVSESGVTNKGDKTVFSRLSLEQAEGLIKKSDTPDDLALELRAAKAVLTNKETSKVEKVWIIGPKELAACIFSVIGAGTIIEG